MSSTRARRVDREAERVGEVAHALRGRVVVEQDTFSRVGSFARTMFSATVITGISMKCWCTIPIPASIAALRRARSRRRLALDPNLALLGRVEPVEDVHQRRLARPVLAEERVHLAPPEVEADVVVGNDAREALRDPAELENNWPLVVHRAIVTLWRGEHPQERTLRDGYEPPTVSGMPVSSPAAICSCTRFTFVTTSAGTLAAISPRPTPPEATSKTESSPPAKLRPGPPGPSGRRRRRPS